MTHTPETAQTPQTPTSACCDALPMDGFEDRCSDCREAADFVTWSDGTTSELKDGIVLGQFCDEPSEPYLLPSTEDALAACCLVIILACVYVIGTAFGG